MPAPRESNRSKREHAEGAILWLLFGSWTLPDASSLEGEPGRSRGARGAWSLFVSARPRRLGGSLAALVVQIQPWKHGNNAPNVVWAVGKLGQAAAALVRETGAGRASAASEIPESTRGEIYRASGTSCRLTSQKFSQSDIGLTPSLFLALSLSLSLSLSLALFTSIYLSIHLSYPSLSIFLSASLRRAQVSAIALSASGISKTCRVVPLARLGISRVPPLQRVRGHIAVAA